jgi:UDP-N-acetylglucosamine acyltransferase
MTMATLIADTAEIDREAEIDDDVEIGPYCVIGPEVSIGKGTRLLSHVCLLGCTALGRDNVVHPFAVIGGEPMDLSYRGTSTRVEIGDRNVIREAVTIHRASEKEEGLTRIGSDNLLMVNVHVSHDGAIGDRVIIAANTMLAGHVHVDSGARISAGVGVHQFVTIGGLSYVGGLSRIYHDVPPYMIVEGNPSRVRCINKVGLTRRGIARASIAALHEAHRLIYRSKMNVDVAAKLLESNGHLGPEVHELLEFIEAQQRGGQGRAREAWRRIER